MNFVDTNIFVYSLLAKQAPEKHTIAVRLLDQKNLVLSSQVVNELGSVLLTKGNIVMSELLQIVEDIYATYDVIDQSSEDILQAFRLREQYNLAYWDGLVVATALRAGAMTLFSEDMQDGQTIDNRLTIVNPFLGLK